MNLTITYILPGIMNRLKLYVFDLSCIVLSLISSIEIKNSILNCSEKYVLVALDVAVNKTKIQQNFNNNTERCKWTDSNN